MILLGLNTELGVHSYPMLSLDDRAHSCFYNSCCLPNLVLPFTVKSKYTQKILVCASTPKKSDPNPEKKPNQSSSKPKRRTRLKKTEVPVDDNTERKFPAAIPKKPRRSRCSEAAAVEDYVRNSLGRAIDSIQKQNPDILKDIKILKDKVDNDVDTNCNKDNEDGDINKGKRNGPIGKDMLVEEENPNWPLDADVGWGIKASGYFEQYPIKNVIGQDGTEIDWEGEIDDSLVKEINCLEWESFAFHPSPLIVLFLNDTTGQVITGRL